MLFHFPFQNEVLIETMKETLRITQWAIDLQRRIRMNTARVMIRRLLLRLFLIKTYVLMNTVLKFV